MKFLIYLILLFVIISCREKVPLSQSKGDVIPINLESDHFGKIEIQEVISLESNLESFIGEIARIKFIDHKIFILDGNRNKLMAFHYSGKFYKRIESGKGPGELLDPIDYDFDEINNIIYVMDVVNNRLEVFDFQLNHLKTHNTQHYPLAWFKIINNDKIIAFIGDKLSLSSQGFFTYAVYNKNFESVQNGFLPYYNEDLTAAMLTANPISRERNNDILLCIPFDQNIYKLDTSNLTPDVKYTLDFGEYNMERSYLEDFQLLINKFREGEFAKILGDIINTDELLIVSLAFRQKQEYIIYSKETEKIRTSLATRDLPYGVIKGITDDNEVILAVEAIDLLKFIQETGYDYPAENIQEDDNVFLLLVKFSFDEN